MKRSFLRCGPIFSLCLILFPHPASAQSNIDPVSKWSWSENAGWFNWFDNGVSSSARVRDTFLSGFIWSEELGWIFLGNGAPAGGTSYSNLVAGDTGVNIAPSGDLYGYAWAENFGWINFDTAAAAGPGRARVQFCCPTARFLGYAWAENVGWINLETAFGVNLGPGASRARGDMDGNGARNGADIMRFVQVFLNPASATAPESCAADLNLDGIINNTDLNALVTCVLTGACPCP